ncbi:MAG: PorT family protein [Cyclobacteriaceae bacterium]|nr:PorT family protein [Cyclobacteriaceae bacterium]
MRFYITLLLISISSLVSAQGRNAYIDPFLKTQWYLGFFGGVNLTGVSPVNTFYGYAPLNYNVNEIEKSYNNFSHLGTQAGLVFMFYTEGFTIGLKPGIHSYTVEHSTRANWVDSNNASNALEINYKHTTNFHYLEFPLTVQYDLISSKVRPYVGVGGYYGLLLEANRTIERSGTDSASGSSGGFTNQEKTIGVNDLFITSSIGILGFVGASYDPGNIRITLDLGYKYGLNNITSTENRYLNNDMAAIGEATDDLQLRNLYLTLGFVFPLKFISKQFNAVH